MGKQSREKRQRRSEVTPGAARTPPASRRAPTRPAPTAGAEPTTFAPLPALWREHWRAAVLLSGLALAVRVLLLLEIARTPYLEVANIDSDSYHRWAVEIANGHWLPTRTFYQSPFYAYYLAVLYKLFGVNPWAPRLSQIVIGSLSPVFLYAIGTRLFSRRVGWIAGLALCLYGPMILEEITLSKTSLLVFTVLLSFAAYLYYGPRTRLWGMALAGFFFGVSVVGVAQWLAGFALLAAYAALLPRAAPPPRRALNVAAFAGAGLIAILPVVWWNTAHGGGLVLTSGGAGLNLYTGNNARASALPASPRGVRDIPEYEEDDARRLAERELGHPLEPAQVSRYWSGQALAFITQHPGDYLALLGKKFVGLWNHYELSDSYHYTFMRTHFLPLLYPTVTFAVVAPLALVGLVMPFWRRHDLTALYVVTFAYLATPLMFYVRSRYRLPGVPFLIVFAAVALDRVVNAVRERDGALVVALGAGVLVAGVFVNHEYCEAAHDGLPPVCLGGDTWYDQEWLKLTSWYEEKGDLDRALAYAERARECTVPRSAGQISFWIAGLESKQVQALVARGAPDEATAHFKRAESAYRSCVGIHYRPGATYAALGALYDTMEMTDQAVVALEAGLAAGGMDHPAIVRLGRDYVRLGRCKDAERVLSRSDRERGFMDYSDETKGILTECRPG